MYDDDIDCDIDTDIGFVAETTNSTETYTDMDVDNSTSVSDTVGSDSISSEAVDSEAEMENEAEETDSESENEVIGSFDISGIFSELEYIDYLLLEQNSMIGNTVSGNSVMVSLDSDSTMLLQDVQSKQDNVIDSVSELSSIVGMLLLVVFVNVLVNFAKRTIKQITGRKD